MSTPDTTALLTQLRAVRDLTHTEIQIAETRTAQARTDAVRRELTENAENARARADAIEAVVRQLGGVPQLIGPLLGRATAAVKALGEQAQPLDEALLGDLALEHQLLDRARYIKALAATAEHPTAEALADRLIAAHTATVDWLTTVLAEEALGGPAALRRTPLQAATGTAVKLVNLPVTWSARRIDRALDTVRGTRPAVGQLLSRGAHATTVATKAATAAGDSALRTVELVTTDEGEDGAAEAVHRVRTATGLLDQGELPIPNYDRLGATETIRAIRELDEPGDIRAVVAYEEAHRNRHGVVSAAQTRLAALAGNAAGLD
ncbi:ferritin-like domain-containing protein [Nocardia sp. NPDC050697]|uniref:ferritin-like domain-containing protein n=1 Tax=Nocardia sp. NPDC050697 TaxID=3155158 RepID=UPI0033CDB22E